MDDEHEDKEEGISASLFTPLSKNSSGTRYPSHFFERPPILFSEFAAILNFQVAEQKALWHYEGRSPLFKFAKIL